MTKPQEPIQTASAVAHRFPRLGTALCGLIEAIGVELVGAQPITRTPSQTSARQSFRLTFADGRVLKGRYVESASRCADRAALATRLNHLDLSRVVAHRGNAMLEEWVPGAPFAQQDPTMLPDRLSASGELLARINMLRDWPTTVTVRPATADSLLKHIARRLTGLTRHEVLSVQQSHKLQTLARSNRPRRLRLGVVHHDFCADNLVVAPDGRITAIDNEDIHVGIVDKDLARTSSRWPMTRAQRRQFLAGYRRHRNPDSFIAHEVFWSIWALSGSALFQVARQQPYTDIVGCLRRLTDGAGHAVWPG